MIFMLTCMLYSLLCLNMFEIQIKANLENMKTAASVDMNALGRNVWLQVLTYNWIQNLLS